MTRPTATEETGHIWIDADGGQRNLTAEVAEMIASHVSNECDAFTEDYELATSILSHPYIAEALAMKANLVVPSGEAGEMKK